MSNLRHVPWSSQCWRILACAAIGCMIAIAGETPAPSALTPFGGIGPAEPRSCHHAWSSFMLTRKRRFDDVDLTIWELNAGAHGPLASGADDGRLWQTAYDADVGWRVHQEGSYSGDDARLNRGSLGLRFHGEVAGDAGVAGRFEVAMGDSSHGSFNAAPAVSLASTWRFGNDLLIVGASYASLLPCRFGEKRVMPLVEYHALRAPGLHAILGFPRSEVHWSPTEDATISVRYRFPTDADLHLQQAITEHVGLALQLWHRERAWGGWIDDQRLYIRDMGLALLADIHGPRWRVQAGPVAIIEETWRVGRRRRHASRIARPNEGLGFLLSGAIDF